MVDGVTVRVVSVRAVNQGAGLGMLIVAVVVSLAFLGSGREQLLSDIFTLLFVALFGAGLNFRSSRRRCERMVRLATAPPSGAEVVAPALTRTTMFWTTATATATILFALLVMGVERWWDPETPAWPTAIGAFGAVGGSTWWTSRWLARWERSERQVLLAPTKLGWKTRLLGDRRLQVFLMPTPSTSTSSIDTATWPRS